MWYPEVLKFRVLHFGNSKGSFLFMCDDLKKDHVTDVEQPVFRQVQYIVGEQITACFGQYRFYTPVIEHPTRLLRKTIAANVFQIFFAAGKWRQPLVELLHSSLAFFVFGEDEVDRE